MRKTICLLLVLSPALLPAAGARAQSQGPYFGAGVGSSNATFNSSDFSLGLPQVSESQTKTSTGAKVFAGFRFNRYVGAEVAYVDLGTFKYHYDGGAAGSADLDYKVSGFTLSGLVILPMSGEFFFFGRLGAFGSTAKTSFPSASGNVGASFANAGSDSSGKTNLYFGIGAQYDFTRPFAARVEYENYGEVGDSKDTGRANVCLISASLLFRF
jgi:OmpA-OmpF porin, OOP family